MDENLAEDHLRQSTTIKTFEAEGFREETLYGFPTVKNPFNFWPDQESCTEKEIKKWEEAKALWRAGAHDAGGNRSGWYNEHVHVLASDWGIGVSTFWINEKGDFAEDLERIDE